jgi:hypothetical protein
MFTCSQCDKSVSSDKFNFRWYVYDNGEQTRDLVCQECADLHDRLVKK